MDEWIMLKLDNSNSKNVNNQKMVEGSRRTKDRKLMVELKTEIWIEDKGKKRSYSAMIYVHR